MRITSQQAFVPQAGWKVRSSDAEVAGMFARELEVLELTASSSEQVAEFPSPYALLYAPDDQALTALSLPAPPEKEQGYALTITESGVMVSANDQRGLYNGVNTLLQVIEQSREFNKPVPAATIRDWPDYLFRGFHMSLANPSTWNDAWDDTDTDKAIKVYEVLFRRLARYKYTHVIFMFRGNMELREFPDVWAPIYSQDDVRRIVALAHHFGLIIVPDVHTLSAFVEKYNPEYARIHARLEPLLEPEVEMGTGAEGEKIMAGSKITFKVRNDEVNRLVKSVLGEVIDIFDHPKLVHIGGDEATYFAASQPPELDRGKLFAEYFNDLNAFVKSKGAQSIMWYDMLLSHQEPLFTDLPPEGRPGHGGPPLNTAGAVKYLDKDIIIAIWHYGYGSPKKYPTAAWFREKGFKDVISCTWFRHADALVLARDTWQAGGMGFMGSAWSLSWQVRNENSTLSEAVQKDLAMKRQLASFPVVAEISWNPMNAVALQPWDERELEGLNDPYTWEKIWMSEILTPKPE